MVWTLNREASTAKTSDLLKSRIRLAYMSANLSIDPDVIERAFEVSRERTREAAVTKALEEFVALRGQKRLLDLMGKLEWGRSFDFKQERSR
jgi:hypothetical protein